MGDSVQLFSIRPDDYAQFRPTYPNSLFKWLAEQCPATRCALDVAAGSGQATRPLLDHFHRVVACDASSDQLTSSTDWRPAERFAGQAEQLPLRNGVVDLIVVAQALHWFATPAFFAEAKRVLSADGLFCAWCYSLLRIEPSLDAVIGQLHDEALSGYWPQGRASVDAGYRDIQAPFETFQPPAFAIEVHWNLSQLLGYLRTWSAVKRWQQTHGRDPVTQLEPEFRGVWGNPELQRRVRWPLHFIAGYPGR
ncbi:class I SAM-dependent methyltransferase [Stutzerimonas xanthomarina]|uniref:Methyltransferase domain-containing protein n=2 Tax=Stutzerimonas xanthomarina TaxID=271420 RepID=A0A1M5JYJ8_9GAMM|nr:class I SAM-dependent methyltransferase [Stutzerimonas xanthomarina]MCP9339697.1 class I SAM-dependent methyltransferase [Stutzerimonas xanthomarina]SEI03465.1 Methyltransferase domain-containing protein [Stutzerimonas xanthomarina]SHG45621.1 Methyltransferase domain-containing protein [Stutzerimonas xanthomarina DSM 18231]